MRFRRRSRGTLGVNCGAVLPTPRVSDGNAHPEQVIGVELRVVDHVIPMCFGAGKEIAPEVIPDTRARMKEEVGAVEVGNAAAGNQIAIAKFVVEEHSLPAHASHEVATDLVGQARSVNRINVVQEWAVGLEAVVYGALVAKGDFSIQAKFAR